LLFMPVIIWNIQNHFVSFLFHSGRVEPAAAVLRLDYFFTELLGEILYTSPVNLVLIILAVVAFFKGKFKKEMPEISLLIWSAIPLIITFLAVSLSRRTLPHWNGPGYLTLIPLAALWIRNRTEVVWPSAIKGSLAFMLLLLSIATLQISTGFIPTGDPAKSIGKEGENDFSLDLYGWRQLRKEFIPLASKYEQAGVITAGSPIVSYRWFPAANYSYYAARGTNRFVMASGDTSAIHKYAWINEIHGGFRLNSDAWYITSSRDFRDPQTIGSLKYETVSLPDTIPVMRMGKPVYYFYVYRMKNLQSK